MELKMSDTTAENLAFLKKIGQLPETQKSQPAQKEEEN
jgi:hypothetical protein